MKSVTVHEPGTSGHIKDPGVGDSSRVVRSLEWKRRATLVVVVVLSLLGCGILGVSNVRRAGAYLEIARDVCAKATAVDTRFSDRALRRVGINGHALVHYATESARDLDALRTRLETAWTPYVYSNLDHALLAALATHRDLYRTLRAQCETSYPESSPFREVLETSRSGYRKLDSRVVANARRLPALSEMDADRLLGMLDRLAQIKSDVAPVRRYCDGLKGWFKRFADARNRMKDRLNPIRTVSNPSYDDYRAVASEVGERQALRSDLQRLSAPSAFAGAQSQLLSMMDMTIESAGYYERFAEVRYYYPTDTRTAHDCEARAMALAGRVTSALDSAWRRYLTLRERYDYDPLSRSLDPAHR